MAARKPSGGTDGVRLVIVESPNKAQTISRYLGDGYVVESSIGHIRDLPRGASDVPAKYKGESWARLGVDVDHDFEPLYVVTPDKKAQVAKLKSALAGASELWLATDEDREGEAIAWHLLETLNPKVPVRRMVFHEITPGAIRAAAENTRDIDDNLVDAQETRRILDRLYGYEVSPVLWKKVMPKLSAGPRAVGRHPHHRRARTRPDRLRLRQLLGHRRQVRHRRAGAPSPLRCSPSTASGSPSAATSTTPPAG